MPVVQSAPRTFTITAAPQPLTIQSPSEGQLLEDPSPPIVGLAPSGPSDSTQITIRIWSGFTTTGSPIITHTVTRGGGLWVWDPVAPDLADGDYTVTASQGTPSSTYGVAIYGVSPYQSAAAATTTTAPTHFSVAATTPPHPPTVTIITPSVGGVVESDATATGVAGDRPEDRPNVTVTIYNNVGAVYRTSTFPHVGTMWSYVFSPGLPDGAYQIEVTQDSDGGLATSGRRSFTVSSEVTPPPVSPSRRGVRELPPLRQHYEAETPTGRFYRWGDDERLAENTALGERHSSTMPGGFESLDCTLPRRPGLDYHDLERLTTLRAFAVGGDLVWEGRLERAPATSGDQMSISPSAVGWQAALEDNKSVQFLGIDSDLSAWGGMPASRQVQWDNYPRSPSDGSVVPDDVSGVPGVQLEVSAGWTSGRGLPIVEAWYDARGVDIGSLIYAWTKSSIISGADPDWYWGAFLSDDVVASSFDTTGNLRATGPGSGTLSASADGRRFAGLQFENFGAVDEAFANWKFAVTWQVSVVGDHNLPLRVNVDDAGNVSLGFWASDIVRHVVPRFAPYLRVTGESVGQSGFVIPQFSYLDATTAGELVRQATRVGLQDWGVWDDRTFWWGNRGSTGRAYRARIGPAQLTETGPQVDRLWNGVVVQFQDVSGETRTVGPSGSGADVESADLLDPDPSNPATEVGVRRWDMLQMSTATVRLAQEVGRRFLEEQRLLDTSGSAQLVGHVQDDRGVWWPASRVRAGDTVSFTDAADSSARRVVRADYDHGTRTCSIDLDSPPEGLAALLERLGVALVPLGVGA